MKENFDKAITFTLSYEGGYSNDPKDPGGETKYGISKRYHPNVDIKNLTQGAAMEIYRKEYWDVMKCDDLPFPLDICIFDSAVNPGPGATTSFLKLSTDWRDVIMYRIQYYLDRHKDLYLRGWLNRCRDLWNLAKGGLNGHQ